VKRVRIYHRKVPRAVERTPSRRSEVSRPSTAPALPPVERTESGSVQATAEPDPPASGAVSNP
jgi:hypothetical protein